MEVQPGNADTSSTSTSPLVTVIMPVYNAEAYVGAAISSILNQTYKNLELLLADDGSTDNSRNVISSFKDARIRPFYFDSNQGYVSHLNRFLNEARGKYIARMDADDISLPERLSMQVDFLERNQQVGLCGTQIVEFDDNKSTHVASSYPVDDESLRVHLVMNSRLANPSVMFRRSLVQDQGLKYEVSLVPAEDYFLWYQMSRRTKLVNLPQVLLKYRLHSNQITQRAKEVQRSSVDKIRAQVLTDLMGTVSKPDMELHLSLLNGDYEESLEYVLSAERWLRSVIGTNRKVGLYDPKLLTDLLGDVFFTMCTHLYKLGWPLANVYFMSEAR